MLTKDGSIELARGFAVVSLVIDVEGHARQIAQTVTLGGADEHDGRELQATRVRADLFFQVAQCRRAIDLRLALAETVQVQAVDAERPPIPADDAWETLSDSEVDDLLRTFLGEAQDP